MKGRPKRSELLPGLAPLVAAVAIGGCGYGDGPYHQRGSPARPFSLPTCPSAKTPVRGVTIDTDALLETDAGKGAGVLIEYTNGGHWHVFTVCDTSVSGYRCEFDVTAQVIGGTVANLLAEQLESTDVATSYCSDTAVMGVTTGSDFDGMWFDTTPVAPVRVTAALGQTIYENVFFWISGGVVHEDAASNPFELTPTAP